ncbi:MAG: hypothetical protein RLZZ387_1033 [Chloroflexota bacterium]|jgi:hypothetical protein
MPRRKRQNPLLAVARAYLSQHMPELKDAPLHIRMLDGPPGSPRYAVTVESCLPAPCPHGVPREVADAGGCTIYNCPIRDSVRLLLDRGGEVMQVTRSGIHWG